MITYKGRLQIPSKTLSMRHIWVVRGGCEIMDNRTKHKMPKLAGNKLNTIIQDQIMTNTKGCKDGF